MEINGSVAATGIRDLKNEQRPHSLVYSLSWMVILIAIVSATIYLVYPGPERESEKASANTGYEIKAASRNDDEGVRVFTAELGRSSMAESANNAFGFLAGLWGISPLSNEEKTDSPDGLKRAVQTRGLRLYEYSGDTASLMRLDYPALLELYIPEINEKRYVALAGMEKDIFLVNSGQQTVSMRSEVLKKYWTGAGYIIWRNYWNLPLSMHPGEKGPHVQRLQKLLREAGMYTRPVSGRLDRETISAVKAFQSENGIEEDGVVGSLSLMNLYRSVDAFGVPKLTLVAKK